MKKSISFILAVGMLTAAVSCSSTPKKGTPAAIVQTDELSEAAYKKLSVEVPDGVKQIYIVSSYNNGENLFLLGLGNSAPCVWTAKGDFTEIAPIELPDLDFGANYTANVTEDGKIAELLVHADYGDLPEPDYDSEDFNAELYDNSAEYSLKVCLYDTDGGKLENTVSGYTGIVDRDMSMGELVSDGKKMLVELNGSYELFTVEGEYIGEVTADDGEVITAVGRDKNGIVVITEKDGSVFLRRIGESSAKLTAAEFSCNLGETVSQISKGTGGYSLFLRTRSRIYGVGENGEISSLFNCSAAEVNGDEVSGFCMDGEGNFTICENSYVDNSVKIAKYTQCDPSELENIPVLEVGIREGMERLAEDTVEAYNSMQSDIVVKLVEYDEPEPNQATETLSKLENDIISGNLPDMFIMTSVNGRFCGTELMEKGVFCDLTEFMADDDELRKDNIFPEIFNILTRENGEIPLLSTGWRLELGNYGKSAVIDKYLEGIETFDIDGYLDFLEKLPKDKGVESYYDTDTVLNRFTRLSWMTWVDVENATCSFDSDSFIRFLNYAAAGTGDIEQQMQETQEIDDTKDRRQYLDDTAMMRFGGISGFSDYMTNIRGSFGGEKLTIIGLPTLEGGRTYAELAGQTLAIADSSDMKAQAWEFLKYYMQNNSTEMPVFPLTISGFDAEYERLKDGVDDEELGKGWYYWDGKKNKDLGSMTESDKNYILELLGKTYPPKKYIDNDDDTPYNIYYEETDRFFAGEYTAEKCAEVIQNRMETYLSEQFG